ncbi:CRISPR-associated endonuclease Cas6 [candidate division KSB1 bacterium]|nr:CRISPR-associated endonuclease Cas6 [candidate division KSB1 bacterium]
MSFVTVKYIRIVFNNLRLKEFDIPKFRGYLAQRYAHFNLIHNHLTKGRLRYAYPAIQFKVLDGFPAIIAIGLGIDVLKQVFMDINEIDVDGKTYQINEKSIVIDKVTVGQAADRHNYNFLLPWMGLNQTNHTAYQTLTFNERPVFLEKILRGNLKSLAKGFDYFIPDFENVQMQAELKPVTRNFKNNRMLCFEGCFSTNFLIPDYLGLGKQTARGFGTVVRVKNHEDRDKEVGLTTK